MRENSSNFDPCFFWRQGIQMVVLNWQRLDKAKMLNEGMFTGEEGWVLKPKWYRPALAPVSSTSCCWGECGKPPGNRRRQAQPTHFGSYPDSFCWSEYLAPSG